MPQSLLLNTELFGASANLRRSLLSNSFGYRLEDNSVSNNTITLQAGESVTWNSPKPAGAQLTYIRTDAPVAARITKADATTLELTVNKICILDTVVTSVVFVASGVANIHMVQG